jgi:hypothetical protein
MSYTFKDMHELLALFAIAFAYDATGIGYANK